MKASKATGRLYYEELRLLLKDTFEAIYKLKKVCTDRSSHYIFINDHIGDVVIALGYLKAFRKKINAQSVTIVVTEKYIKLAENYSNEYEKLIVLSQYELYRILLLNATTFGEKYLQKEYPNVTLINPADSAKLGFEYLRLYPDMNLKKMIMHGCYELSPMATFKPLPKIQTLESTRRVLLTLEARTISLGITSLYKNLVQQLKALDYEVYLNTKEDDHIQGATPIYKDINELRSFIGNGVLIGVRSGLHDLMLYQDCKVIAIYPNDNYYGNLFSLNMMPDTVAKYLELKQSGDGDFDSHAIIDFIRGGE